MKNETNIETRLNAANIPNQRSGDFIIADFGGTSYYWEILNAETRFIGRPLGRGRFDDRNKKLIINIINNKTK